MVLNQTKECDKMKPAPGIGSGPDEVMAWSRPMHKKIADHQSLSDLQIEPKAQETVFKDLQEHIHKNYASIHHITKLKYIERIWIREMCMMFQKRLEKIEYDLKEAVII
jgi:hypothetical protein